MSYSRQALFDLIKELKPPTDEEKQRFTRIDDFQEWHKDDVASDLKDDFPIKRIRLRQRFNRQTKPIGAILSITYTATDDEEKNPRKIELNVPMDKLDELNNCLTNAGINLRKWSMLAGAGMFNRKLDWSQLREHYDTSVDSEGYSAAKRYQAIHKLMLKQFERELKQFVEKNPNMTALNLIDKGCGQDTEMLMGMCEIAMRLIPKNCILRALAYDAVKENVDVCNKKTFPDYVKFIQYDSNNIDSIISDNRDHLTFQQGEVNMQTSSGSTTRLTLRDAFEAVRILQKDWQTPFQNITFGGHTSLLFNRRMLKRLGYLVNSFERPSSPSVELKPVLTVERVPENKMLEKMKLKLHKKPHKLDLSLNPQPELFLAKIASENQLAEKITSIDLSFSGVKDFKELARNLQSFPNLKEIVFNYSDPREIVKMIQHMPPGVMLKARYTDDETVLFVSESYLQRSGKSLHDADCDAFNKLCQFFIEGYPASKPTDQKLLLQCLNLMAEILQGPPDAESTKLFKELLPFINFQLKLPEGREGSPQELANMALNLIKNNKIAALRQFIQLSKVPFAELCKINPMILVEAVYKEVTDIFPVENVNLAELDVSNKYFLKSTLMMIAIEAGKADMIPILAKACPQLVNLSVEDRNPFSTVLRLIRYDPSDNNARLLTSLMECKPSMNANGDTPFHIVVDGELKAMQLLQKTGYNFFDGPLNKLGETPFQCSLRILDELTQPYKPEPNETVIDAASNRLDKSRQAFNQWKIIFHILLAHNSMDQSDDPAFEFQKEKILLKPWLIEIAKKFKDTEDKDMRDLIIKIAEKYKCNDAAQVLQSIPEEPSRHRRFDSWGP